MNWRKKSFLKRPGFLLLALVLVLGAGWAHRALFSVRDSGPDGGDATRTVVIGLEEQPSEPGELHGTLSEGTLTSGVRQAEVLSDRDCAPDAEGISHCLNELDLGDERITIRHHHRMAEVPCLRPGETVTVVNEATGGTGTGG